MELTVEEIQKIANEIREDVVEMLVGAGSGHSAGSLGMADVFAALYLGGGLNYRVEEPEWEGRDRLILSAGHLVPVLYATLARVGFFVREELFTLRQFGSRLQGHPHHEVMNKQQTTNNKQQLTNNQENTKSEFRNPEQDLKSNNQIQNKSEKWREVGNLPGIEAPAGPLGQGVSVAVGRALALRARCKMQDVRGKSNSLPRVICVGSDGELQEGQVWEALMSGAKYELDHLTYIVDRNHIQIGGFNKQVMPLEPLKAKLEAFGWFVIEVDGHNIGSILEALAFDASVWGKPVVIIAHTIPGKGVDFMEGKPEWHGKVAMGPGEAVEAVNQLHKIRTLGGKIRGYE